MILEASKQKLQNESKHFGYVISSSGIDECWMNTHVSLQIKMYFEYICINYNSQLIKSLIKPPNGGNKCNYIFIGKRQLPEVCNLHLKKIAVGFIVSYH